MGRYKVTLEPRLLGRSRETEVSSEITDALGYKIKLKDQLYDSLSHVTISLNQGLCIRLCLRTRTGVSSERPNYK